MTVLRAYPAVKGFTLLEMLIALVIVAILAAVALPSYNTHVMKGKRSATQSFMMQVAQKQEQYLLDARQYAEIASNAEFTSKLGLGVPSEVSSNYNVTVAYVGGSSRTYQISAVPTGKQASDTCGTLRLDNAGAKSPTTSGCW